MKSNWIKIKTIHIFYFTTVLIQIIIPYSKTKSIIPVLLNEMILNEFPKEGDPFINEMFEKWEKLKERQKILQNDINKLININQNNKLQIELNKIYIKVLYILIFIFLFIIVIIIIFKFYFQCNKKKEISPFFYLKDKFREDIIEK